MTVATCQPVPGRHSFTHDHRGRALSPAMSQLLNSTVIPVPKKRFKSKKKFALKREPTVAASESFFDDLDENELNHGDDNLFNLSYTEDTPSDIFSSLNDFGPELYERAGSPASVDSDWTSDENSYSVPSSGFQAPRRKLSVRNKVEHPFVEPCNEHPLAEDDSTDFEDPVSVLPQLRQECSKDDGSPILHVPKSTESKSAITLPKSFVSNLSSSLKTLQSVAASLSSSQDKLYSRNLFAFSPRQMDEPIPQQLPNNNQQKPSKSISLRTYNIQSTIIAHLRPRELRINSQFYRVYAAETLMRKNGKLDDDFAGRAKPILEPRRDNQKFSLDDGDEVFGIRKRFVSQFDVREKRNKSITSKASRWHVWTADDVI